MKSITTIATAIALSLVSPALALAESHHGHNAPPDAQKGGDPMQGKGAMMKDMMGMMMPMMMQMHRQMHGGSEGGGMAMMDGDLMRMMMGSGAGGDPMSMMQSRLSEFDADGDGTLSLSEFETLHSAMIRETMVDRFQHLDADGDGRITADEMGAPAKRMEMRGTMPDGSGMMGGQPPSGN
ncbi:EF-hand domain-containing protein [Seohaeicola nanhaiensis]|uniref:EF-hand domain-containing protein n=1 Tax=Seohaeicola nanhaiensis TaxID=1387282 RepID=A0ABV9KKS6_9RHOB